MDKIRAALTARVPCTVCRLSAGNTLTVGMGVAGTKGAVYTPHITDDGILSWTNDGGRDNPAPVDIKGPKGDTGPQGPMGPQGPAGKDAMADTILNMNIDAIF